MSHKEKQRLKWVAGSVWALVALILVGTYWKPFAHKRPVEQGMAHISEENRTQLLQKASLIRDKFRPWAQAHQTELQRMLDADEGDAATFNQVSFDIPNGPEAIRSLKMVPEDIGFFPAGEDAPRMPWTVNQFSWWPMGRTRTLIKVPNSQSVRVADIGEKFHNNFTAKQKDQWRLKRDVALCVAGREDTEIVLWASGRVTETTLLSPKEREQSLKNVKGRAIQESDLSTPPKQVEPAYDFLTPRH